MEGLTRQDLLHLHGMLRITLKIALTGRGKLTYTFMMDTILLTKTMIVNMIGMTSQ